MLTCYSLWLCYNSYKYGFHSATGSQTLKREKGMPKNSNSSSIFPKQVHSISVWTSYPFSTVEAAHKLNLFHLQSCVEIPLPCRMLGAKSQFPGFFHQYMDFLIKIFAKLIINTMHRNVQEKMIILKWVAAGGSHEMQISPSYQLFHCSSHGLPTMISVRLQGFVAKIHFSSHLSVKWYFLLVKCYLTIPYLRRQCQEMCRL